jgi:hypothetical protein
MDNTVMVKYTSYIYDIFLKVKFFYKFFLKVKIGYLGILLLENMLTHTISMCYACSKVWLEGIE